MTNSHFIVSQRENAWQVSYKGDVTAPFTTRGDAIDAAIAMAGTAEDKAAEVIVRDADLRSETVWRADGSGGSAAESANPQQERDA